MTRLFIDIIKKFIIKQVPKTLTNCKITLFDALLGIFSYYNKQQELAELNNPGVMPFIVCLLVNKNKKQFIFQF